jgi:hypothetical protein
MRHIGQLYWFSHSQNLKKEEGGRGLNGRAWLHLYWGDPDKHGRSVTTLGIQWVLFRKQHSIGWSFSAGGGDSDRDIDCSVRVPWFGVYLGADDVLPRKWEFYNPGQRYPSERTIGVTWHSQALWIDLWRDPDEGYGRGGPKFWQDAKSSARHIVIHPLDILFGKTKCATEKLAAEPATVDLPEGAYPVQVVIERRTWTRKRAPWWKRERVSADVQSEKGIPIPGKGENSWDCEDDAYFSIGTPTQTTAEAVAYAAERVREARERYGGRDWTPAPAR